MSDLIKRLRGRTPKGATGETALLLNSAADRIEALERENERLRDINAILEDCMSKGMVIRKKETA